MSVLKKLSSPNGNIPLCMNINIIIKTGIIKDKVNIVYNIKDEDFGQRHFIVEGPNEILIDVIQPIPPSEEFLKNYL